MLTCILFSKIELWQLRRVDICSEYILHISTLLDHGMNSHGTRTHVPNAALLTIAFTSKSLKAYPAKHK